jgi:arginine/lysine/ornithine decarboxylase
MASYLLSIAGGCPDILLVGMGGGNAIPASVPLTTMRASGILEANKAYHIHATGTTPITATLPACTTPGDAIFVEVAAGKADVSIVDSGGTPVWAIPGPNPQATVKFICNGAEWEAEE